MELFRPLSTAWGEIRGSALSVERVIGLSSWMVVLGTIRLVAVCADYAGAFFDASRFQPFSLRMLSEFAHENSPVFALSAAWPLLVAIALRRTRWPELLLAAALTFLFLSVGGAVELTAQSSQARSDGETIGSFHLTRRAFLSPTFADLALVFLGASQLMLELVTAVYALFVAAGPRGAGAADCAKQDRSRRARWGRLAVYAAIAYLFLMVRLPVWSTYLEVLSSSTLFREFIIRNDIERIKGTPGGNRRFRIDERLMRTRGMMTTALQATVAGRFALAGESYKRVIAVADSSTEGILAGTYRSITADASNNLAWLQATCPDVEFRDPERSVENAHRATELDPANGNFWNTLGAAHYRNGNWAEADRVLLHSMELRNGGDSFDWFFLAVVRLKLGRKDDALRWYNKAVDWYHASLPLNQELHRFQVEAAKELGLAAPPYPPPASSAQGPPLAPVAPSAVRVHNFRRDSPPQ
jgi:tetratricopeptide (TPR) repeat protein